jgi:GcrA cell cycle regulator
MANTHGPWTDQAVELFTALWAKGNTSSQIALALCRKFGPHFTRNSVIGKRMRMGLPGRSTKSSQPRQAKVRVPREKRIRLRHRAAIEPQFVSEPYDPIPFVVTVANPKTLLDLNSGDCRWPLGDGPYMFCANEAIEGCSYCLGHARMAYTGAPRANVYYQGRKAA